MSEGPSIYEQLAREKKLARARRAANGADTTLDEAEERHDAIWGWVYGLRYFGPIIVAILVSWVSMNPFYSFKAGFFGVLGTLAFAAIVGGLLGSVMGPFVKFIQFRAENVATAIGGAILTIYGVSQLMPGVAVTGAVLAVWPWLWNRWARGRMKRTDYSRLKHQSRTPQEPDFIIE